MEEDFLTQLRRQREEYAANFDYDLDKIVEDLQRREVESGREYISLPPKAPREYPVPLVACEPGVPAKRIA